MKIKPTMRQMEFQEWEFGIFLHFGIRTYYEGHRDWDGEQMPAEVFNPEKLDCDQWIKTAKNAGMNYSVFVAKHHDGFANWPSKYTDYSVASTPWKGGKGDVVLEYVNACRKYGMRTGIYYSPADASLEKTVKSGKEYDDYFIGQIGELLTGYGKIDVLWFDGCGSEGHRYDWKRIMAEIRKMQPEILIFNMGDPDFRWVGNEAGIAPSPCWNVVDSVPFSILTDKKEHLGEEGFCWLPAECDCRMRLENWFYSEKDENTVKSLDELMGIYYYSVGRGANLLLNIGPDRRGLLPELDTQRLTEFGEEIKRRFSNPIATLEDCKVEEGKWKYTPSVPVLLDHVVIKEDLTKGENVKRFRITINPYPGGEAIIVYEGGNIGHKAICRFPTVKVTGISFEVLEWDESPGICGMEFFYTGK